MHSDRDTTTAWKCATIKKLVSMERGKVKERYFNSILRLIIISCHNCRN